MIATEIFHFGHIGAEKIEFEVGRSIPKMLKNDNFPIFWGLKPFKFTMQGTSTQLFEGKLYFPVEGFKWYNCPRKIRKIIEEHMTRLKPEHRSEASDIIKML